MEKYATLQLTPKQAQILHEAIMYFARNLGGRPHRNILSAVEAKLNAACKAAFDWEFARR